MKTRKQFWPLGIFIFLLVILGLPHLRRLSILGSGYTTLLTGKQKIIPTGSEETYAYATLANRVRFGQPINDPFVWEYKDSKSPFLSELAPSLITGWLAKLIEVPLSVVIVKIIGPIILVCLLYRVGINIGTAQITAMSAAIAAIFLPKLFALLPYPEIFTYISKSSDLEFQRVFHPLLSWVVAAGSFWGIQSIFKEKFSFTKTMVAGSLAGILFYTYFFAWTTVWFGLTILVVLLTWQKKFGDLKRLMAIMIIGLGIGVSFFINGWEFSRTVLGQEFWVKSMLAVREIHVVTLLRYAMLAGGIIFIDRAWWRQTNKLLLWSMMTAAILLPDLSQLILGSNLESDHWIGRFLYPLSTFLMILTVGEWKSRKNLWWNKAVMTMVLSLAVFRVSAVGFREWKQPAEIYQLGRQRQELYDFLSNNIASGSVIGSLSFTEQIYLAAYTPFYPFIPRLERTVAPNDEPMQRLLFIAQQLNVPANYFDDVILMPSVSVNHPELPVPDQNALAVVFGIRYIYDLPPYDRHQSLLKDVKEKFQNDVRQDGRLDYLLISPTDRYYSPRDFKKECDPLFDNGTYQVYLFDNCQNN